MEEERPGEESGHEAEPEVGAGFKPTPTEERLAQMEGEVARLKEEVTEARRAMESWQEEARLFKERLAETAARYRKAALAAAPEVPEELVTGDTVEDIDRSLAAARATVEKIRRHLEAQGRSAQVPVGAPPRRPPDLSGLNPREKIAYGLSRSNP